MLKKIDQAQAFLEKHHTLFRCPYCQSPVTTSHHKGLVCQQRHQFDLSKKGTLHLMKQPANTDYGKELFEHRRHMMQAGLFDPILAEISPHIQQNGEYLIVDIGCGEGTHLAQLQKTNGLEHLVGIDIAKEAILQASNHYAQQAFWCLADLTNLPFADESCTALINILTPSHYREFQRVLAPEGQLLKVVPNEYYLIELRQQLYGSTAKQSHYSNEQVLQRFKEVYPTAISTPIKYTYTLTEQQYEHLLHMTPLLWGVDENNIAQQKQSPLKSITIDVTLLVAHKNEKK